MAEDKDWLRDSFRREFDKSSEAIGRFNLAIFGKTGVGKSTLINAIFGEEVARTGIGEPVTRGSHLYLDKVGSPRASSTPRAWRSARTTRRSSPS